MKKFVVFIGILAFLGCAGVGGTRQVVEDQQPGGRRLIVNSNREEVINERIYMPPVVTYDGASYLIHWMDKDGNLGLFIGPHSGTNIIIKEGKGSDVNENNKGNGGYGSQSVNPDGDRDVAPQNYTKAKQDHI